MDKISFFVNDGRTEITVERTCINRVTLSNRSLHAKPILVTNTELTLAEAASIGNALVFMATKKVEEW